MKNIPKPERNWTYKESEFFLLAEQGRYEQALDVVSKIQIDYDPKILLLQLQCYLRSDKPHEALKIITELESEGLNIPHLSLLKGQCLFLLKEYATALISFKKCSAEENSPEVLRWIQKCQVHLTQTTGENELILDFNPCDADYDEEENSEPILNYDYFQTNTHVVLFINVVGAKKDKSTVEFHPKSVDIYVDVYDAQLHFPLAGEIDPNQSTYTIGPFSIECKLLKVTQGDWKQFEDVNETIESV